MSAPRLLEGDVDLIIAHLRSNIAAALSDVRTDRTDDRVTTEPPQTKSYFTYWPTKAYQAPAIIVMAEAQNNRQAEKQSNFIASRNEINVAVVIEDREEEKLTRKAFRYASALHQLLECQQLTDGAGKLKIHVRVDRVENGDIYFGTDRREAPEAVFRRAVTLYCEVEHFENF